MKSTTNIKQNNKNAHSMSVTNSVLSQIYRSPCTKSYAAYQILSAGNSQSRRVEQYNASHGISLYNCFDTLNCSFDGIFSYFINAPANSLLFGIGTSWSSDGTKLAVASPQSRSFFIFDSTNGNLINSVISNTDSPFSVSFSPDGTKLAVGFPFTSSNVGYINIYDSTGQNLLFAINDPDSVNNNNSFAFSVSWSPDGTKLLVGIPAANNGSGACQIFEYSNASIIRTISNPNQSTNSDNFGFSTSWSSSNKIAIGAYTYGENGTGIVYIFNSNGNLLNTIYNYSPANLGTSVAWSPDGTKLAVGAAGYNSSAGIVYIVNPNNGNVLSSITSNIPGQNQAFGFGLSWSSCIKTSSKLAIGAPQYNNTGIVYIYK